MRAFEEDPVRPLLLMMTVSAFALAGCGGTTAEEVKPCAKVGERCRKAVGGLGVCVRNAEQTGFDCSSQN